MLTWHYRPAKTPDGTEKYITNGYTVSRTGGTGNVWIAREHEFNSVLDWKGWLWLADAQKACTEHAIPRLANKLIGGGL